MKATSQAILAVTLVLSASAVHSAPGRLGTLPLGTYACSEPGDAGGAAWIDLPDKHFTIDNGSTYHAKGGSGTYLLTGKMVTFTRGPMKGMRFQRSGNASLRWIDETGEPGRVRCIRKAASR
jgi:hypothetical protein